ncbi:hypothetical protein [Streptomyces sp. V3I7]|uniref:hypothetical protein n=1 Tax=Streptomyces sp. V3I7 TaxID=3042278 RepID=UPI0027869F29|nr:hypothetical protein [Streptomyces sp. V3I7]MDQ0992664.1 hypothetical protein [Streptomyces sp. V3I7]
MADEQCRWLDSETAERLLRGEPLEAVGAADRDQAERLARALGALTAGMAPAAAELPGEEAALAAFRKAHEAREAQEAHGVHEVHGVPEAHEALRVGHVPEGTVARRDLAGRRGPAVRRTGPLPEPAVTTHAKTQAQAKGSDAGLIRIGGPDRAARRAHRPSWGRPVRLALTAALAAGMVGGVAVAAGTGVLPTPFHRDGPAPDSSVSAAVSSEQPLGPTTNDPTRGDASSPSWRSGTPGSGGAGSATPGAGASNGKTDKGENKGGPGATDGAGTGWNGAVSACRDVRDGKELKPSRRAALDSAAGGAQSVGQYCERVLEAAGDPSVEKRAGEDGGQGDEREPDGSGGQDGQGQGQDQGSGGGDGGLPGDDVGGNDHHEDGGAVTPLPTAIAPSPLQRSSMLPAPAPTPTYSAL